VIRLQTTHEHGLQDTVILRAGCFARGFIFFGVVAQEKQQIPRSPARVLAAKAASRRSEG